MKHQEEAHQIMKALREFFSVESDVEALSKLEQIMPIVERMNKIMPLAKEELEKDV